MIQSTNKGETTNMNKYFCPAHEKIEAMLEEERKEREQLEREVREGVKDQWEAIAKKVAISTVKWGVATFLFVVVLTVGFLWNNQRENRNEIMVELKAIVVAINGDASKNIKGLKEQLQEVGWKVDQHIHDWPTGKEDQHKSGVSNFGTHK